MTAVLDKWKLYKHPLIAWDPNPAQYQVATSPARHKVLAGGRRLGKDYYAATDLLLPEVFFTKPIATTLLARGKKRIFWIVGPCVDTETEILTQRGWLRYDEVQVGDQTLGITEAGTGEWTNIEEVNVTLPRSQEMVSMETRGHSSLTTPNHKWLVEYTTQNTPDGKQAVLGTRWIESDSLGIKSNEKIPCAKPITNLPETAKYTDAFVELVAWYWTEGTLRNDGGVCISQDNIANPTKVERLRAAIKTVYGIEPYYNKGKEFYIKAGLAGGLKAVAPGKAKAVEWQFITELTQAQLELFIQTSVDGDGSMRHRGTKGRERVVVQKVKHNLDVLQMACQLAGYQTTLKEYVNKPECPYVLQIFERNSFYPWSMRRKDKVHKTGGYQSVPYNGVVWCPTTGTRTWLARRNGTVYFTGNSYQESEKTFRVIWNWVKLLEIPMEKGSFNSPEVGLMKIVLWGGALEIIGKSAQVPERLVGEGLSGVVMCEAAKMRSIIWPKYIQPTLADFDGWSYFGSTPEGKNWFYDLWRHAQDPYNAEWASWRMPSWVNQYVYREPTNEAHVFALLEEMRRTRTSAHKLASDAGYTIDKQILARLNDLPPELFLQEIAADFTEFVGRVFKEFDEEVHVTDLTYNPGWETYAALDYGFNNPSVWLLIQVGKWGEINVLDEIYESGLDPEDFADEVRYRRLNPDNLRYIFPDPADPGATKIMEKKLNVRAVGGTGGELNNRINWIRKFLREPRVVVDELLHDISGDGVTVGSERPRLLFDRKCKRTIEDMLAYRYPDTMDAKEPGSDRYDRPLKDKDHGPEALGRFCAGKFGQFGKTGTRVHQASFSREDDNGGKIAVSPSDWYKSDEFKRPAAHENRRTQFPKVNTSLSNYLSGVYDD